MEPSSFMISISAPAGCRPASRARSTAASVWPGRRSTPFSRARSGLIWPGRPRSAGRVAGSASARMVAARSWIDTPVVQPPPRRSTVTVNGVPKSEVLFSSIMLSPNCSHRSSLNGAHSTPRPSLSMKLTISGVIFSAATMKSPSFSRSSSSTTMTTLPARKSSMTSSTLLSVVWFAMKFEFYRVLEFQQPRFRLLAQRLELARVPVGVEQSRIVGSLVGQIDGYGGEDER